MYKVESTKPCSICGRRPAMRTKASGKDPADTTLIVFFVVFIPLLVVALTMPEIAGFFGQFYLPAKLHTPKLDSWNVLASGGLYVLSYPAVCKISGSLVNTATIACPSDSYIAVLVDLGYHASCNSSAIYIGWNEADGFYGYTYIYRAKTLSCSILYPPGGNEGGGGLVIIPSGAGSSGN